MQIDNKERTHVDGLTAGEVTVLLEGRGEIVCDNVPGYLQPYTH